MIQRNFDLKTLCHYHVLLDIQHKVVKIFKIKLKYSDQIFNVVKDPTNVNAE